MRIIENGSNDVPEGTLENLLLTSRLFRKTLNPKLEVPHFSQKTEGLKAAHPSL